MTDNNNESYLKFIVIGSSGVGKTAILNQLVSHTFSVDVASTVGVEFSTTDVEVQGKSIKLQIWDTAGQERYRSIAKSYYHNANGILLVFDLCERKSFEDLTHWIDQIHEYCPANVAITLVGNKSDKKDDRAVPENEAKELANAHKLNYVETSALTASNIEYTFQSTAEAALRVMDLNRPQTIPLSQSEKKNNCC